MNDDYFYQTDDIPPIDIEQMRDLLAHPPKWCGEEGCPMDEHRKHCKCIKTIFVHETHYEHYLELVKRKVESAFVDLILKDNKKPSK
tara:strand:+ start:121 stop:381 length:261 start_codon:yes stop_codon:yes gene_type:complete